MKYENYWGINDDYRDDLECTDNIHVIMQEQCKYLDEYTQGKIFADFREIKENIAKPLVQDVLDIDNLYYEKYYGFEIYTKRYKFRLFELIMSPIYPVEIIIDEGICNNISSKLIGLVASTEKDNHFKINNENIFCKVLQLILQDKKVRYILYELQTKVMDGIDFPTKIIICEGRTDEIILQAIAKKLNHKVSTVIAMGKYKVPVIFKAVKSNHMESDILIVVDSDGDEEDTRTLIERRIGNEKYVLVIINNCIEDWFMLKVKDFSKIKLLQSIDEIVEKTDFDILCKKHKSFAEVVQFIKK